MKVLLLNPEMPGAFWSFKETCKIAGTKALLPPLGLLTVAALFPQEWEYRLADLNTGKKLTTADWQWADLVMISGMIIQKLGVLALIREAKSRGKTVLVGGPYATSLPEAVLAAGVDFLVRGEGENTIPLLLAAMSAGEKTGVFQAADKPDMALSPVPRFDLLNLEDYNILGIQTSRGCPFDCEFCDVVNLFGRVPRYKSPQQVLAELEALYRLGWRGGVFICDDNFIGNKDHTRAILGQLTPWMKEHDDPFGYWTQASVNLGQNTEIIDLLTAANFGTIFLGVETPDEELLKLNRKYQNLSTPAAQSLTTITANGLTPMASFVIGFDHEKPGAGERICQFVEENHIPLVMLNTLYILPNTSLWQRLQAEGRLREVSTSGDVYQLGGLNYLPDRPEAEILREYVQTVDRLYEPSRFLARAYQQILTMRPTRRQMKIQAGQKSPARKKAQLPWRKQVKDLLALVKLVWRQGIWAGCRGQFWRQLWGVYRKNPSRLRRYIVICALGESVFGLRREVLRQAAGKGITY